MAPYGGLAAPYRGFAAPYGVSQRLIGVLQHLTGCSGALWGLAAPYGVLRLTVSYRHLTGACVALHGLGIGKVASIDKRAHVFHYLKRRPPLLRIHKGFIRDNEATIK